MTPREQARRLAEAVIRGPFKPEALYTYTDEKGAPAYWRIRARLPDGQKWIRPMRRSGEAYELGEPEFPVGKPLYLLHELTAKPGAPCWFVEGENCADALEKTGVLATTAGGATSDERTDFSPLKARTITISPDNDKPGLEHAARVAEKLRAFGCHVETIDAAGLGLSEGGDCVDWIAAHLGATTADLAKLPRVRAAGQKRPHVDEHDRVDGHHGLVLRRVSDVVARPVNWLWPGRIARGKVTMLAGHPGLGKSQMTASLAAIVTMGGRWPVDGTSCGAGSVLILSAEDDVEDTIRPRLEAAGADLGRCRVLDAVQDDDGEQTSRRAFSLSRDLVRLEAALAELGDVALVIVDPVTAYLGETDSHKAADVRAVLAPLAEVAARRGVAVVAVSHLRKSTSGDAMQNVTGSLAFVAAARAVYIVAKDQTDPSRRLLLPAKNNLGDDKTGYAFRIEPQTLPGGIETSRVTWEAERVSGVTAEDALAPFEAREERSAIEEAGDFLRSLLADAPLPAKRVLNEAREAGHAEKTLRRAAKATGVEQYKDGMQGGWLWRLMPKMVKAIEDGQPKDLTIFANGGHLRPEEDPLPADDGERF
jgi:KaiC/GvpD/RAD55 family RecA-like ATPase